MGGEAAIRIGDITGGQVLFAINGEDDRAIVDTISVEPGDLLHFDLGDKRYYVSVVTLRNFLVGDDFAEFEVSTRPPLPEPRTNTDERTGTRPANGSGAARDRDGREE